MSEYPGLEFALNRRVPKFYPSSVIYNPYGIDNNARKTCIIPSKCLQTLHKAMNWINVNRINHEARLKVRKDKQSGAL